MGHGHPRGGVASWVDYDNDGFLDLFLATRRVTETPNTDNQAGASSMKLMDSLKATAHQYMKGKIPGTHFLLRNTDNGNHWIKIKLSGTKSNRDGYGAKVFVSTDDMTQFQEAGVSGKMLFAQNDTPPALWTGQGG